MPFHHHHPYYPHMGWHCRPSRVLWFVLGAGVATIYMKNHERHRDGQRSSWFTGSSYCNRSQVPLSPAPILNSPSGDHNSSSPWNAHGISRSINNAPPAAAADLPTSNTYDEEKERIAIMSQKAGDKLVEMSEATLDTVLSTVEVLKQKIAEHRAERMKQQSDEESKQNPSDRLV